MRTKRQALFCAADLLLDSSELGSARLLWLRSRLFAPQAAIEIRLCEGQTYGRRVDAVAARVGSIWSALGKRGAL